MAAKRVGLGRHIAMTGGVVPAPPADDLVAAVPGRAGLPGPLKVYGRCMGRTNIEIDDELVTAVMRRFGLRTKREAVDLALRRLAGPRLSPEFVGNLEGIGWTGDLEEMRAAAPEHLSANR